MSAKCDLNKPELDKMCARVHSILVGWIWPGLWKVLFGIAKQDWTNRVPSILAVQFVARINVSGTVLLGCLALKYNLSMISE